MPWHVVAQGEWVARIAWDYGIGDGARVWEHPENAALRAKRGDPNLLHPGDRLFIPEARPVTFQVATGRVHRFVVKVPRARLRLVVHDEDDQPLASRAFTLTAGRTTVEGTSDGDGVIEVDLPVTATTGQLEIDGHVLPIRVGQLDPLDELSGVQGRLENLGFLRAPQGDDGDAALRAAVQRFQAQSGLEITGEIDADTRRTLGERHGC